MSAMKEILQTCLNEKLTGKQYEGEQCAEASKELSESVRDRLKGITHVLRCIDVVYLQCGVTNRCCVYCRVEL